MNTLMKATMQAEASSLATDTLKKQSKDLIENTIKMIDLNLTRQSESKLAGMINRERSQGIDKSLCILVILIRFSHYSKLL